MPPTTDEIEAAAGDLRAVNAPRTPGGIWDRYPTETVFAMRYTAQVVLADAWLAANPAGDSDPIDAAHLESLGLERFGRPGNVPNRFRRDYSDGTVTVTHRPAMVGWPETWVVSGSSAACTISVGFATTRGRLRRLLAALGVPAAEGGAP